MTTTRRNLNPQSGKQVPTEVELRSRRHTSTESDCRSSVEARLHTLLGRLVHAYARFDWLIGLQLNWLGPRCGVAVQHVLSPRVPFQQRFELFKSLALETFGAADNVARDTLVAWFERIGEARAMRNDYAHGRWGFPSPLADGDREIEFVPLSWEGEAAKQPPAVRMTLDELAADVAATESLFDEFRRLENRYRRLARIVPKPVGKGQGAERDNSGGARRNVTSEGEPKSLKYKD